MPIVAQYLIMNLCGQLLHLFLIKVPSQKAKARAVNKTFSWKEWWLCDWNVIVSTQIIFIALIVGWDQFVAWKPEIADVAKWFFLLVGAFGSTVAMAKFSSYEKNLMGLIDIKSNVSDEVTGGTTTVKETIEKAAEEDITVSSTIKKTGTGDGKGV